MARHVDLEETERRVDFFLDLDAELMRQPNLSLTLH
jgi:hypothetical protein